mgnify:FL=1
MNTPICDFVRDYAARRPDRLHMPGHKGRGEAEQLDITEITGADVLYHPRGIILESEKNAAALFGSRRTVYSAEGSSLSIRAMVFLAMQDARKRGKTPRIAAGRNAHKVFITAAALLDVQVQWLYPAQTGGLLTCQITPETLEEALGQGEPVTAVYVTSPDYLGNVADISGLSRVCRRYGCLLLVDNAHGAYLGFLPEGQHPMAQGADMCCDSAHKTLPVLTGGGYLHISSHAPGELDSMADSAMALFASTSPSYLILQSLDAANGILDGSWKRALHQAVIEWAAVKRHIGDLGFCLTGQEPLKLTVMPKKFGYTGEQLAELLEGKNIYCEFADPDYLVLMLPVEYDPALPRRICAAFEAIAPRAEIATLAPTLGRGVSVLPPHAALFHPAEQVALSQALGRVMADPTVSCPPAIPVACCGERIDAWAVEAMEYYGITQVRVLCP